MVFSDWSHWEREVQPIVYPDMARYSTIVYTGEHGVWAAPAMAWPGRALALGGTSHTVGLRPEV